MSQKEKGWIVSTEKPASDEKEEDRKKIRSSKVTSQSNSFLSLLNILSSNVPETNIPDMAEIIIKSYILTINFLKSSPLS